MNKRRGRNINKVMAKYSLIESYSNPKYEEKARKLFILNSKIKNTEKLIRKITCLRVIFSLLTAIFGFLAVGCINEANIKMAILCPIFSVIAFIFGAFSYYYGEILEDNEEKLEKIKKVRRKLYISMTPLEKEKVSDILRDLTEEKISPEA